MKVMPLRLPPCADLRRALEAWVGEQQQQVGCVLSAVGSLSVAQLRLVGATQATAIHGELEIINLSGTPSPDGFLCAGSLVRTTAEQLIGLLPELRFSRELDPATGHLELRISPQAPDLGAAAASPPAETPARPPQR
jgi:predicted DNA-binding protein with PD1-like motif